MGPEEVATVASVWSGIPVKQITADERMLLVGLDEQLKKRVIGQDEAVAAISRAVKRSRVGLKDPDRPIAAMIFCGPTGVGKTELTKALAACYFGSVRLHATIMPFLSLKAVLNYSLFSSNLFFHMIRHKKILKLCLWQNFASCGILNLVITCLRESKKWMQLYVLAGEF